MAPSDTTTCRRCGTCCQKGGPALHRDDRSLVETGRIPAAQLYTIRKNERVRDNVRNHLAPAAADIIKIKGRDRTWTCVFYDPDSRGCRIYPHRPLECRVLKCWDTRDIERLYDRERLTRRDLVGTVKGLWELIADHEKRCAYRRLDQLIRAAGGDSRPPLAEITEMIAYDREIRRLVVEKGVASGEMLDFLFGRPITRTIHMFGVRITRQGNRLCLVPAAPQTPPPAGGRKVQAADGAEKSASCDPAPPPGCRP